MCYIVPRCEICNKKIQEFDSRITFIEPPINQRDWVLCGDCTEKLKNYIKKENEHYGKH